MRLVHVLRRERKWAEGDRSGPYWFELQKHVDIWNSLFHIDFASFRGRLSEIRESGRHDVGYDILVESWQPEFFELAAQPGNIMVGCDEDDWLDPMLPEVLRGLGQVRQPIRWHYVHYFGPAITTIVGDGPPNHHVHQGTNMAFPTPVDPEMVTNHMVAENRLDRRADLYVPMSLGVHNRSPVSASHLWDIHGEAEMSDLLARWCGPVTIYGPMPPAFCMPLVERVRELCLECRQKKQTNCVPLA